MGNPEQWLVHYSCRSRPVRMSATVSLGRHYPCIAISGCKGEYVVACPGESNTFRDCSPDSRHCSSAERSQYSIGDPIADDKSGGQATVGWPDCAVLCGEANSLAGSGCGNGRSPDDPCDRWSDSPGQSAEPRLGSVVAGECRGVDSAGSDERSQAGKSWRNGDR